MVSRSGPALPQGPEPLNTLIDAAGVSPRPPQSAATRDSGRPASVSACHSGAFQEPFLSLLMVCASARCENIFSAVSATMFSLSATAFLVFPIAQPSAASFLAPHDGEKPLP